MAGHSDVYALPALACACASARRTARLITQLYSHEMGSSIEPTQFALLSALRQMPGASQTPLGHALGLDKTTLSRNLRVMEKNGWIALALGQNDRRERGYQITAAGKKIFSATQAGWQRAQSKLQAALSPGQWDKTLNIFNRAAQAALAAQAVNSQSKRGKHA